LWDQYPEISSELDLIEEYIKKSVASRNKLLVSITEELVNAGGKRLRPSFVVIAAKFGNYSREKVLPLGGAIEILHTATLVHDDIVDRASCRRGRPTVSEKYGVDMAVYTGDFLFTKAVLMLSKNVSTENLDMVARAIKTVCEGEVDQFQDRFNSETTVLSYLKRINKKTAILFCAASLLGADSSGCTEDTIKKLVRFSFYYGMAFQIRDDMFDFISNNAASGKPVGNDLIKGVITLPVIYALGKNNKLKELFSKYTGKKDSLSIDEIIVINELVKECGGIEASGILLEKYIKRGTRILDSLPVSEYRTVFMNLINNLKI
jgi:heptaprenyl diphosphate synthase